MVGRRIPIRWSLGVLESASPLTQTDWLGVVLPIPWLPHLQVPELPGVSSEYHILEAASVAASAEASLELGKFQMAVGLRSALRLALGRSGLGTKRFPD